MLQDEDSINGCFVDILVVPMLRSRHKGGASLLVDAATQHVEYVLVCAIQDEEVTTLQ